MLMDGKTMTENGEPKMDSIPEMAARWKKTGFIKKEPLKLSWRRQNRLLGNYLAGRAWVLGLDCIALDRPVLETYLDLAKFRETRLEQLRKDLKPWFPFQETFEIRRSKFGGLFLSRINLENYLPKGQMTDAERIANMPPGSPRAELFSEIPSEEEMFTEMVMCASGYSEPTLKSGNSKERGRR